jgi:hypothetical protein
MDSAHKKTHFNARLIKHPDLNAAYIEFPYNVEELFGKKGQVKVKVLFDNLVEYRGSLANMGSGCHVLGVTLEIRSKLNKSFGDNIDVTLEEDLQPREILVPETILQVLKKNPEASAFFDSLSFTHRKELISWLQSAKKEVTRNRRLTEFIQLMENKKKLNQR